MLKKYTLKLSQIGRYRTFISFRNTFEDLMDFMCFLIQFNLKYFTVVMSIDLRNKL